MRKYVISALAGLTLVAASGIPTANAEVSFGITLGVPLYAPAPVYYEAPVYYAPRASYYRPSQGHHGYYGHRDRRWDRDGDGIPNYRDRDRDGDGVRNSRDRRPDNPRRY